MNKAYSHQIAYKSSAYDKAVHLSHEVTVKDWGKEHLEFGIKRANALLREAGIFQKNKNEPYQKFYEMGWFVKGRDVDKQTLDMCEYKTTPKVFITPEGMAGIIEYVFTYSSRINNRTALPAKQKIKHKINTTRNFIPDPVDHF